MRLAFPGLPETPARHLSVDGMSPDGPNLSHWPGNRTPVRWKADLSTGICLNFVRAPASEQEAFLDGVDTVLNDHYDTDGFASLLTVLRPDFALAHADALLAAAATGDYQRLGDPRGFAVDRIVLELAGPASPEAGRFTALSGPAKDLERYRWLIDHAAEVLDPPARWRPVWQPEFDEVQADLARDDVAVERDARLGRALVRSRRPVHRMALNTLAGDCFRVLHAEAGPSGCTFRFHDRTESWFEVVSFRPLPRCDLRPLAARLQQAEPPAAAPANHPRWCADPPDEPVPELYFGWPEPQAYGRITRRLAASSLAPDVVCGLLDAHLETEDAKPTR
jgi:hypothetical protein